MPRHCFLIPVGPWFDRTWLIDSVTSCVDQGPDVKIMLVNDGNKDHGPFDELKGPFVDVLHRKKTGGVAAALNDGWQAIPNDVEFVLRMDADDVCLPNRVLTQFSWMSGRPKVLVCGGRIVKMDVQEWDRQLRPFATPSGSPTSVLSSGRTPLPHPTWMMRKDKVEDLLGKRPYPESYPFAEDYALLCKVVKVAGDDAILDCCLPLSGHRLHDDRVSHTRKKQQDHSRAEALKWFLDKEIKDELAGDDGVGTVQDGPGRVGGQGGDGPGADPKPDGPA